MQIQSPKQNVNSMLAELCDKVQTNCAKERTELKGNIRFTQIDIKDGYINSAVVQNQQGTLWKVSSVAGFALHLLTLVPANSDAMKSLQALPDIASQLTKGFNSNLDGRVTLYQGKVQTDQKELDLTQTQINELENIVAKIEKLLESAQREEAQAIGR